MSHSRRLPRQLTNDDHGRLNRWGQAAIALIVVIGLAVTLAGVELGRRGAADQRSAWLDQRADEVAAVAGDDLTAALAAAQRASFVSVTEWPTVEEFEAQLAEVLADLDGDPTVAIVLRPLVEEAGDLLLAERANTPAFMLVGDLDAVIDGRYRVVMRSTDPLRPVGAVLGDDPVGAAIAELPLVGSHVLDVAPLGASETRMTIAVQSRSAGPDGRRHDSTTLVEFDVAPVLERSMRVAQGRIGAQFSVSVDDGSPISVSSGARPEVDAVSQELARRSLPVGFVELDIEVWPVDSPQPLPTGLVILVGTISTGALALLAYLVLSVLVSRRRAAAQAAEARRDHLTGIPNRRWVMEYLSELEGKTVAVLFCDLDRFKVVNDSAGHGAGDQILIDMVERFVSVLSPSCRVARFGGDEFLVVCAAEPGTDIAAVAESVAVRLGQSMRSAFQLGAHDFTTTVSIGIASTEQARADSGEELIRAADVALGMCKQAGRDGYVVYDDRLREAELDRLSLERDLRRALDVGALELHYQPIVDRSGEPVSVEALVRWNRAGEVLPPGVFLPVVADIGRMGDLGEIVLERAISEFCAAALPSTMTLHVNVDAAQLADRRFPSVVTRVLHEHGLESQRLILELTEGAWFQTTDAAMPVLADLADIGVQLAIDDFGAGHSNLARTVAVRGLTELKLDRSLVNGLDHPRNLELMKGITATITSLGLTVIAEGIETELDEQRVIEAGVTRFQGFRWGRPRSVADGGLTVRVDSQV